MDALLAHDGMPAVEVRAADEPFVVVFEHASNRLPPAPFGALGTKPSDLERHIAREAGAALRDQS